MITTGDLVRPASGAVHHELRALRLGIVLEVSSAWPGEYRDETQTVKVLGTDGHITEWYDWQLYVIDEWTEGAS